MSCFTQIIYLFTCIFGLTLSLYEDQVGKFEWRQQYIGKTKFSALDTISPVKKIVVASEKNVIAALSLKSGDLLWRHALSDSEDGLIQSLWVDDEVVVVTGAANTIVRGFELEKGYLLWEWGTQLPSTDRTFWIASDEYIVYLSVETSRVKAIWFNLRTGQRIGSNQVNLDDVIPNGCRLKSKHLACLDPRGELSVITVGAVGDLRIRTKDLKDELGSALKLGQIDGDLTAVSVATGNQIRVLILTPEIQLLSKNYSTSAVLASVNVDDREIVLSVQIDKQSAIVEASSLDGQIVNDLSTTIALPSITSKADGASVACHSRRDGVQSCRLFLTTEDHVLVLSHLPGTVQWLREEALASIEVVEMLELPVSDALAVESEFGGHTVGFLELICRRLVGQWRQLRSLIATLLADSTASFSGLQSLIRDDFGLHKLIVVVTRPGKIFGLDSVTGTIAWKLVTNSAPPFALYVTRTAVHAPRPAQMSLIGRSKESGSLLISVDPISGLIVDEREIPRVVQVLVLPQTTRDHLRPLLLLDSKEKLHVYPEGSVTDIDKIPTFLYTIDRSSGLVTGYAVRYAKSGPHVSRAWTLNLGQEDAHIIAVVPKRDSERVHSQGRVLGDRSVLYKYVNPNLIAILTMGQHPTHKGVLNVYLVDAISGLIVWSVSHKRAREPIHVVHAENWIVYSWVSGKHRRTEMATVELFEGTTQTNATAFTSLAAPPVLPMAERQAFIFPTTIRALTDTVTEKGITNKHIIVALSSGGVLELPWAYVDPRRTVTVTPELREEGIVPYIPELPLPSEAILNHNQSVLHVRGLFTSPSGLESTSLLLVYGLDVYFTRVAPSKTFDLLKEDFDYVLITAVLGGLILASIVTRRLSSRKALKQAWK